MSDRAVVLEKITDAISEVLLGVMFEVHTPRLREQVTSDAERAILGIPEVWGYNVVCDSTNNFENNRLNVDVNVYFNENESAKFRATVRPEVISFDEIK